MSIGHTWSKPWNDGELPSTTNFKLQIMKEENKTTIPKTTDDIISQYKPNMEYSEYYHYNQIEEMMEKYATSKIEQLEGEVKELRERASKDSDSLAAIAVEYNKLQSQISSLSAALKEKEGMVNRAIDQLSEYDKAYMTAASRIADLEKELEETKQLGNDCVKTINGQTKLISKLRGGLEEIAKGQNGELKGNFIARIRNLAKQLINDTK